MNRQQRRREEREQQKKGQNHNHDDHSHDIPQGRKGKQLPVTILTGYLGAGKTTLLNYLLREQKDKKLAVIENEIGEVSIDDALVEQKETETAEELVVLNNGCICCTVRKDLVTTLTKIGEKFRAGHHLDGVLIELTGMADPAPVVQTFFMNDEVRQTFCVDNVVALVDAKHAIEKLDESTGNPEEKGTACAQIAFSSTVLLNKIDLADEATISNIESRIKSLNSTAEVIKCQNAKVPVEKLFNIGAFDLTKVLKEAAPFHGFKGTEEEFGSTWMTPKMDRSVSNVGVRCEGALNMFLFQEFLHNLVGTEEKAGDFLRIKALLHIGGSNQKFVLQGIHMLKNQAFTAPWPKNGPRENRIIFIGRGMQQRRQELTDGFKACIAKPLRFPINAEVQAKTGQGPDGYENGLVIAHWDECNAYRIALLRGTHVHAPHDDDCFIRKAP
jgi:G3E family GTPase